MSFLLVVYICSGIAGNNCALIPTKITEFKDHYDCANYGYTVSRDFMKKSDREFINEYRAFVQFNCKETKKGTGI